MRISNLLENSSRIVFPLKGLNSEEVIEELLAALHIKDKQKKEYLKAFKEREKDYSTGIGNEIAIPHIRSKKEETFRFAIGISPEGIPFSDPTGCKTKIFFLTISPSEKGEEHLALLSHISVLCKDAEMVERIKNSSTNKEIFEIIQSKEKNLKKLKEEMAITESNLKKFQLLFIVLYREEFLKDILSVLYEFDLKKTNVFNGKEIKGYMASNIPLFHGFRDIMHDDERYAQLIVSVVEEEKIFRIAKMIENICGGFEDEEHGYIISMPVNYHTGI